jgi:hypothetical protein
MRHLPRNDSNYESTNRSCQQINDGIELNKDLQLQQSGEY